MDTWVLLSMVAATTHRIGIWLGTYGPRALALTALVADGWVPSVRGELEPLLAMAARVDAEATAASRDPAEIRRVVNISGTITDGRAEGLLHGPVQQWVEELTDLAVGRGFDTIVLRAEREGQLAPFAEAVPPAVRSQVAAERGAG